MSRLSISKLPWSRVIATGTCLVALAVYSAFDPTPSRAGVAPICAEGGCGCECSLSNKKYSEGACVNNQTCMCIHGDNACPCSWVTGCNQ